MTLHNFLAKNFRFSHNCCTFAHFFDIIMQVITTKQELVRQIKACLRQNKTIGLVPTMGALHEGHAALVRQAVAENDVCVVSVFVNPTQFNNPEDLLKYPRTLTKDVELLTDLGVHFVFAPSPEEMYTPEEMQQPFSFDFNGLDEVMEGKMRPGHFNGVVQVDCLTWYNQPAPISEKKISNNWQLFTIWLNPPK